MKFSHQAMQHIVLAAPETPFALSLAKRASDLLAKQTKYLLVHGVPPHLDSKEFKSQAKELRNAPWHRSKGSEEESSSCEFHDPDCGILSVKVAPAEVAPEEFYDDDDYGDEESCFVVPYHQATASWSACNDDDDDSSDCQLLNQVLEDLFSECESNFGPYNSFRQGERCEIHHSVYVDAIEDVAYDLAHDYSYHSHQAVVYGGWDKVPAYIEGSQAYWEGEYNVAASSSDGRVLTPEYVCNEGTFTVPSDWSAEKFKDTLRECLDDETRCPQNGKKIGCWDVANVQDMEGLFVRKAVPSGVNRWDVSNVKTMYATFARSTAKDASTLDFRNWNVSNVNTMFAMFYASNFPSHVLESLSDWDVSRVSDVRSIFLDLNLTNVDLSKWGEKLTNVDYMFIGATGTPTGLSEWDTSRITSMRSLFERSQISSIVLTEISDWDVSRVSSVMHLFYRQNLTNVDLTKWGGMLTNIDYMFGEASGTPIGLSEWDTSRITSMEGLFKFSKISSSTLKEISGWDVSQVSNVVGIFGGQNLTYVNLTEWGQKLTNVDYMFGGASGTPIGLSEWDTSRITSMEGLFEGSTISSSTLKEISGWDVSQVSGVRRMFYGQDLTNIDLRTWVPPNDIAGLFHGSEGILDPSISDWNVTSVTNMDYTFTGVQSIPDGISDWNVENVKSMISTFKNSSVESSISKWNVASVTDISYMFWGSTTPYEIFQNWDFSNVQNMAALFRFQPNIPDAISSWDVSKVTDMGRLFEGSGRIPDLSGWSMSNVRSMKGMFLDNQFVKSGISSWNVSKVTDTSYLFHTANPIPDLSDWDISNVETMKKMFNNFGQVPSWISKWDTSSVTNMNGLFVGSTVPRDILNDWDFSNVKDMSSMFYEASFNPAVNSGEKYNMHVGKVQDVRKMFYKFSGNIPDISDWDVSRVSNMESMFQESSDIPKDLWKWDVERVQWFSNMFAETNDSALKKLDLSAWNFNDYDPDMSGMFSGTHYVTFENVTQSDILLKFDFDQIRRFGPYFNHRLRKEIDIFCPSGEKIPVASRDDLDNKIMHEMSTSADNKVGCWDLSKVSNLNNLFQDFLAGEIPPGIWGWDVSHVQSMDDMFSSCEFAEPLGIKNWKFNSLTSAVSMFGNTVFRDNFASVDISGMKKNDDETPIAMDLMFFGAQRGAGELIFDDAADPSAPKGSVPEGMSNEEVKNIRPYFLFLRKQNTCPASAPAPQD